MRQLAIIWCDMGRNRRALWRTDQIGRLPRRLVMVILLTMFHLAIEQTELAARTAQAVKTTQQANQPNIVLIISDDQRWSDYGFMNHDSIKTPNLDTLARQGTVFRRGYVPTALCRSSLMTLITGRYAHEHRVCGNDPYREPGQRRDSKEYVERRKKIIGNLDRFTPLTKILGKAGYVSHQSGKWWEGNFKQGGFTDGMTLGFGQHPRGRHGDDGLKIGRTGIQPIKRFVDSAVDQEKPFFLWYAPFMPHTPHNPPERILKQYRRDDRPIKIAKYMAMCQWFDETCGEVVQLVEDKKIGDNTMFIYVCDNGWVTSVPKLNSPEDWKPVYAPKSKRTAYDGGVRTPIMYIWPGQIPAAERSELATSLDIFPTILAAAGIKHDADLPGLNLLKNLTDETPIKRETLFGESFAHDIADLDDPNRSLINRWCIHQQWKLILSYGDVPASVSPEFKRENLHGPQLFDLVADPNEEINLADQHPKIVDHLRKKIADWYPTDRTLIEKQ